MFEINSNLDSMLANGEQEEAETLLFEALDELTDGASVDCNLGDYHSAVEKYRHIINLMQRYYGDSVDLKKIEQNIAEIQRLI